MKVQTEVRIGDINSSLSALHRPITTEAESWSKDQSDLEGLLQRLSRHLGQAFFNVHWGCTISLLQCRSRPSIETFFNIGLNNFVKGSLRRVETCRVVLTNQEQAATPSSKKSAQALPILSKKSGPHPEAANHQTSRKLLLDGNEKPFEPTPRLLHQLQNNSKLTSRTNLFWMPWSISTFMAPFLPMGIGNLWPSCLTKPPKSSPSGCSLFCGMDLQDLAAACFVEWICKMPVPQVINTNLSKNQAKDLKDELNTPLNQEITHNPFIDANRGSCFNQRSALQTRQLQLLTGHQAQDPLINLIDASQRPYILDLIYRLCTNQDLDFNLFTPDERLFWTSLIPQEQNLLPTGNRLALLEYHTHVSHVRAH